MPLIHINLDSQLNVPVEQLMKNLYDTAPQERKDLFDLTQKEHSKFSEKIAKIYCFINEFIKTSTEDSQVDFNSSFCFVKEIQDETDLIGNIALGILGCKDIAIRYQGSIKEEYEKSNPTRQLDLTSHCFDERQVHFWIENITLAELIKIRSHSSQSGENSPEIEALKRKVICVLSSSNSVNFERGG
jgi:hypothetical protein